MFSYAKDIKRFRPDIRIQSFIDARNRNRGHLSKEMDAKRRAVIRDWFKLVLWYVRLRRASKGVFCTELMEVEKRAGPLSVIKNPVKNVLMKNVKDYVPIFTDGEEEDPSLKNALKTEEGGEESEDDLEDEVADYI